MGVSQNTIATDTILEFILRLRAGSLTCTVDGYSFILSMFAFEKCRACVENYGFLLESVIRKFSFISQFLSKDGFRSETQRYTHFVIVS